MTKKKDAIKNLIDASADITGAVGGGVIGTLVAGPTGAIIGGTAGPIVTRTFKRLGEEIMQRIFGPREEVRIGAAYTFAIQKLQEDLATGDKELREDDFFQQPQSGRPTAEEILEGVILTAQREYEERKVPFLGYLYANICTNAKISREHANQLIKTASSLSFRQFGILASLRQKKEKDDDLTFMLTFGLSNRSIQNGDIIAEIRDLQQRGLVTLALLTNGTGINDNTAPIEKKDINISSSGLMFYEMLSLDRIAASDLAPLAQLMLTAD